MYPSGRSSSAIGSTAKPTVFFLSAYSTAAIQLSLSACSRSLSPASVSSSDTKAELVNRL